MGLPPRSSFLWGENYENTLTPSYPLDEVAPGRMPRDGSEWAQAPSGVEEASLVGHDYVLEGIAQWITRAEWSGALGVQAFLDWARDKNTFRFVPDVSAPSFYVDGCYLAGDLRSTPKPTTDSSLSLPITIRHPSVDLGLALRGLMFEYVPGASLTDPVTATYSRASAATYRGATELIASAASGVLRDRHYEGSLRTTLLERARAATGWDRSEEVDHANWTKDALDAGTPVVSNAVPGGDGTTTADRIVENTANALHGFERATPTLTDNTLQSVGVEAFYTGSRTWFRIRTTNKAGNLRSTFFNLATGQIGTTDAGHTNVRMVRVGPIGSRGYRCSLTFNSANGGTTPLVQFFLATGDNSGAYAGDGASGMAFRAMQFDVDTPSIGSYVKDAGARNADQLSWPHPHVPQSVFVYYKGLWLGGLVDWTTLVNVGQFTAGVGQRIVMYGNAAGQFVFNHGDSSSTVTQPNYGDTIELLGYVDSLGRARLIKSVNGGAEVAGSLSGTTEDFPSSYTRQFLDVGHEAGVAATKQVTATAIVRVGPLTYAGVTRDTVAKGQAA